ncbi:MAG TPA: hypothetical protein PK916_02985, partial [Bacteroidota bacterium]|nr:hypothetical protein [Bacteroidota bacterium]
EPYQPEADSNTPPAFQWSCVYDPVVRFITLRLSTQCTRRKRFHISWLRNRRISAVLLYSAKKQGFGEVQEWLNCQPEADWKVCVRGTVSA